MLAASAAIAGSDCSAPSSPAVGVRRRLGAVRSCSPWRRILARAPAARGCRPRSRPRGGRGRGRATRPSVGGAGRVGRARARSPRGSELRRRARTGRVRPPVATGALFDRCHRGARTVRATSTCARATASGSPLRGPLRTAAPAPAYPRQSGFGALVAQDTTPFAGNQVSRARRGGDRVRRYPAVCTRATGSAGSTGGRAPRRERMYVNESHPERAAT